MNTHKKNMFDAGNRTMTQSHGSTTQQPLQHLSVFVNFTISLQLKDCTQRNINLETLDRKPTATAIVSPRAGRPRSTVLIPRRQPSRPCCAGSIPAPPVDARLVISHLPLASISTPSLRSVPSPSTASMTAFSMGGSTRGNFNVVPGRGAGGR